MANVIEFMTILDGVVRETLYQKLENASKNVDLHKNSG
jgi:hypothetical protein